MRRSLAIVFICFVLISAGAAWAGDIRIVAPYIGTLTDVQKPSGSSEMKDSGLLTGAYFQWIDPERYQWNVFAYYAPDVNYSSIFGGHFILDYYLGPDWHGKFVSGLGLETMRLNFDAGSSIPPMTGFTMDQTLFIPYLRAGKYFKAAIGPAQVSLLPWLGIEPQLSWGKMEMKSPYFSASESLDDSDLFGIAGLNLKVNLFRFIDVEGKYQATFDASHRYDTYQAVAFLYLNRSWGLSYRYKSMETTQGSDSYHYLGVAYVF